MHYQKYYSLLILCLGLVACSAMTDYKGEGKFEPRIKAFSAAIRWSKFEVAESFIRKRNNLPSKQNQDYLQQIKITKYEPLDEIFKKDTEQQTIEIISTYTIHFYNESTFTIKQQKYQQLWWYDEAADSWFLDSDLPNFE